MDAASSAAFVLQNATSVTAIRTMMDNEPVLAKKWAATSTKDSSALNLTPDTIQFDDNGNVIFLNLGGMRIRSLPPNAFASLDKLDTLNLGGTDLPLDQMKSVLCELVNVDSVLLGGNSLGPTGAAMVAEIIQMKPSIRHLDMRFNDIGDEGMAVVADALARSTSIRFLYLEGNHITNVGCRALAKALLVNSSIEELYLGANDVGPEGAASLAEVILTNTTLNKLYVDGNQIGPKGAAAFSEALESMNGKATLKQLYVDNNNLGKEAAKRLAKALNSDTAIDDSLFE